LARWPIANPRDWTDRVHAPQTEAELDATRRAVRRSGPFGSSESQRTTAQRLGLQTTLRPRGRCSVGVIGMDRSDVIGKRILRLLRSPFEYEKSDPDLRPGISLGVFTDFRVYIQLDDRSVIRFGLNRRYDPLCVMHPAAEELESLVDYEFDAGEATCVGQTIFRSTGF